MHLIDEMKNDGDAFIIHPEVVVQIANELCAREINIRKGKLGLGLRRDQPARRNPRFERLMLHARAQQEFLH